MQYLLMIYGDETKMMKASKADDEKMLAAYGAYADAMQKAGVMRGGARLRPTADSSTVRVKDGKSSVLNGPYAETREQLGGYFMIETANLDEALAWAARCPGAATGSIEVRPIWQM